MRIKCPNSDIYLELPGDRTDMKFSCPACHKVHRVTVNITTPGEDPPPAPKNTRSMAREQPPIPKKYATGAYAPVVDIPIDANFVLLDGRPNGNGQGIDLGNAANPGPPPMSREFADRRTEIFERPPESERRRAAPAKAGPESPPPPAEPPRADSEETTRDDSVDEVRAEIPKPEGRRLWDEVPEKPAPKPPPAAPAEPAAKPAGPAPARRQGKGGRAVLVCLLLAVVGLGGFLGWQQYLYSNAQGETAAHLERADAALKSGDVAASAAAARQAEGSLDRGRTLDTPAALWNRLAEWSGLFSPLPSGDAGAESAVKAHLGRERSLESFRGKLDPTSGRGMAETLDEAVTGASGDPALAEAMRKAVTGATLANLRARAETTKPEEAIAAAAEERQTLSPLLSPALAARFDSDLKAFEADQRRRLLEETRGEAAAIAKTAATGGRDALDRYMALAKRLKGLSGDPGLARPLPELADAADRPALVQLSRLTGLMDEAVASARTVLSRPEGGDSAIDDIRKRAAADTQPNPVIAAFAANRIDATRAQSDELVSLRSEVFDRMQADMRRNREYAGNRLAWSMLRIGFDDPAVAIDPSGFRFDSNRAEMAFSVRGLPARMAMTEADYEKTVRATVDGFNFSAGWALLFHKPVSWMADLAVSMRAAGINPSRSPDWEIMEGPEGPVALSLAARSGSNSAAPSLRAGPDGRRIFFAGRLLPVTELPQPADARRVVEDFRRAAERLHDAVMADNAVSQPLRQALKPVLMGAYQKPDPRDYFDSAFCRRLLEANYLETYISPMSPFLQAALEAYRAALGKLEAGQDEFAAALDGGGRLVAVASPDPDEGAAEGLASDQDPETGESMPRYAWRIEKGNETVFYSPMPSRFVYAFMLAEHYDGKHAARPAGTPRLTEVRHATRGLVASYRSGADRATGDAGLWDKAIAEDSLGRFDPTIGPPGWNFPLHVLERDDQGDPVTLATLSGTVKSPNFSPARFAGPEALRRAEDEWLDSTARTLATPGELGLIFHQFFRYCSDSPLPELPNLIGSHFGLSDTHQTVYQSLERRWVGRLIGDCDDLAEFFQVLTRKQGKLSHVMQLPGHAAAGYVERTGPGKTGDYRFIVLQTGPVLQFTAASLNEVVEDAYHSFDRGEGISHMTPDAVPLLLRFANEETRTPFVLSARIYEDAEYADTMIRVQGYWHENVYSAAIKVMEEMVGNDPEIGSIKELGSLYERVGMYRKSDELRRRELELVKNNQQAAISTLLEIAQLHFQDKDKEKALAALGDMEARMLDMIRRDDAQEFFRAMTFRSFWAMYLSRLGQPARAWNLVKYDANATKRQLGQVADPVLRTMVMIYDRMMMKKAASGGTLSREDEAAAREVRRELEDAFGRGYFKPDDAYNNIIGRYFVMGRFAVSDAGRAAGIARLLADGPYPDGPRDQTKRGRGVDDEDWKWFRISPQLYLALGQEMLDQDEYPELYEPAGAKPLLEAVIRAAKKGTGLGSDVAGEDDVVQSEMALSFLNRDLAAFKRCLATVKEKDYSSLYDEAAMTFGLQCGLIPTADFPAWIDAFRQFFPGSQHYFKVVYRALDKENYDHALLMAEATAKFFPDNELLRKEAEFVRGIIPGLKAWKQSRK